MLYELKNLIKRYDDRLVLDLKALDLEEGMVTGLLGPNGAGKTTLLEILAFILSPSSGQIYFRNEKIRYSSSSILEKRRKVVLVQQNPVLFTASVFNNVAFPLKIRKTPKEKIASTVKELLNLVGMDDFIEASGQNLSGGETQRVAIAQALACYPEVILLDEPTASVDVENIDAIENIIRDINSEKEISVIFTTHDRLQASRIADNTVYLNKGKRSFSIHENIFSGNILSRGKEKYCVIRNDIAFPITSYRSGSVKISIDPSKIRIIRHDGNEESGKNIFEGRVIQLTDDMERVRVYVEGKIPLVMLLDKNEYQTSTIKIGDNLLLQCPTEGIQIL